ncbi:hypothetical protein NDU88_010333 [Pleurodeles waltl]|uniref:Uncharacterized protein n=1 Tax=Pleurodeles waltl TaxID=8319 RepID=A0AAV7S0H3_PLEWA|nr:hypothetical protein NDU88_010333 [Pleurodeles waltl]
MEMLSKVLEESSKEKRGTKDMVRKTSSRIKMFPSKYRDYVLLHRNIKCGVPWDGGDLQLQSWIRDARAWSGQQEHLRLLADEHFHVGLYKEKNTLNQLLGKRYERCEESERQPL